MGWDDLEPHLEGAASEDGVTIGPQLERALHAIEDLSLVILRVDDSGTHGLTGGEDEPGANFNALTRNTLITSEDSRLRGGNFGLGKSVLWRFSSLSTVFSPHVFRMVRAGGSGSSVVANCPFIRPTPAFLGRGPDGSDGKRRLATDSGVLSRAGTNGWRIWPVVSICIARPSLVPAPRS